MGEQDVADQRGAFACLEGPVTRVVAGPPCVWRVFDFSRVSAGPSSFMSALVVI